MPTVRIKWWKHEERKGMVFKCFTKMHADMFDAIPCNISEPAGFAFRKNTGSRQESLLGILLY